MIVVQLQILETKELGMLLAVGRVILLDYPSKQGSCKHG